MSDAAVLIVGAGPSGLNLALQLSARGVPYRLIDRRAGPGEASRAMVVHARTLEFYQQMGFAAEVVEKGIRVDSIHLLDGGREAAEVHLGDIGKGLSPFPFFLSFPQDDHERLLVDKLRERGGAVEWNTTLVRFEQTGEGVEAVIDKDGRSETARFSHLCGADGGHSTVRHGLGVSFDGGTYAHLYYVADVKLAGETTKEAFLNVGGESFLLRLPVRSTGMTRLIGITPDRLDGRDNIVFDDLRREIEGLLGIRVVEVNWFSTYHVHHRVAERFHVGRCFLLGDAGHVHSPTGGQGMNTGIGDAVNLGWKLAAVLQGRAAQTVLDTYEPERIAFARTLVATTDRAFQYVVGTGLAGKLTRTVVMPHLLPFLTGFSAARRLLFRTVSQTRIDYDSSPLSRGTAGDVEAGDRLPWVENVGAPAQGASALGNFAPLAAMDWQLHVYGEGGRAVAEKADGLGLPVHRFAWSENARQAGIAENACYLIRPDGYVGLALAEDRPGSLGDYVRAFALRFGKA